MASMNWLGFSLSSQELASQPANQDHCGLGFSSDEISGTDVSGECCYINSDDSAAHSLNLPPSFGIFEALNRNNNPEWEDIKGLGSSKTDKYKTSMVMGSSSSSSREQEPKLENLLGRGEHEDSRDYIFPNSCLQVEAAAAGGGSGTSGSSSSIGLSMIKTWLRNQPNNDSGSGGAHTLSLSMSTGSHSSSPVLPLLTPSVGAPAAASSSDNDRPQTSTQTPLDSTTLPKKSIDTFGQRTSIYRGVTRHRWTGRYEAHLWDNSCRREGQTRKGRQVYLGGYDKEDKAARAYDLAALKYWGTTTTTNFPISNYEKELEDMKHMTRQEYVASLRRKSSGFSRGASIYRGVTRHHQHGRWQARIGRVAGNKDLYLGTFSTQEEAAEAYDIAAIKFRGLNAVTNFDMSRYDVKSILESSTLPIGGAAKRLKDVEHAQSLTAPPPATLGLADSHSQTLQHPDALWPPYAFHYPYAQGQRLFCKQEQDSDHHHTFHQDISTHNFLQSNSGFLTIDSSSSHSASMGMDINNNSLVYAHDHRAAADANSNANASYGGYQLIPLPCDANQNQRSVAINHGLGDSASAYETVFTSSDPYHHHARNLYNYISHQSAADDAVKASVYDQASACNTWVPTAIPTLAPRSTNMPLCPTAPPFTLLHE